MTTRRLGIAVTVIGAIVLVVSLTADLTGLGDPRTAEIGPRQRAAIAVAAIIVIVGLVLVWRGRRGPAEADSRSSDSEPYELPD